MQSLFMSSFRGFSNFKRFLPALIVGLIIAGTTAVMAGAQMASPLGPLADESLVASLTTEQREQLRVDVIEFASLTPQPELGSDPNMRVGATPGPNAFSSASWAPHAQFGQFLLRYLGECAGVLSPGLNPTAYRPLCSGLYMPRDVMVTSFNSWWATENPGAPFGSEYGNRLHFPLVIEGDGSLANKFSLSDVNFDLTSTDGVLDYAGNLAGTTCNGTTRVCLDYGPDGIKGTPDDIVMINNEPDTTLMDALYYIGVGNAYWPGAGNPGAGQGEIDTAINEILDDGVGILMVYSVYNTDASINLLPAIFHDGFETGDVSAWSASIN